MQHQTLIFTTYVAFFYLNFYFVIISTFWNVFGEKFHHLNKTRGL